METFNSVKWLQFIPRKCSKLPAFDAIVMQQENTFKVNESSLIVSTTPHVTKSTCNVEILGKSSNQLKLKKFQPTSILVSSSNGRHNNSEKRHITVNRSCIVLVVNGKLVYKNTENLHRTIFNFGEIAKFSCVSVCTKIRSIEETLKKKSSISIYQVHNPTEKEVQLQLVSRDLASTIIPNTLKKNPKFYFAVPSVWIQSRLSMSYKDIKMISHINEWSDLGERDIYHLVKLFPDEYKFYSNSFSDILHLLKQKQNKLIGDCEIYNDLVNLYKNMFSVIEYDQKNRNSIISLQESSSDNVSISTSTEAVSNQSGKIEGNSNTSTFNVNTFHKWTRQLIRIDHRLSEFATLQEHRIPEEEKKTATSHNSIENLNELRKGTFITDYTTLLYHHVQLLKHFQNIFQLIFKHLCCDSITSEVKMWKLFSEWSKCEEYPISQDRLLNYIIATISDAEVLISKQYFNMETIFQAMSLLREESCVMENLNLLEEYLSRVQQLVKFYYSQCVAAKNFLLLIVFHTKGNNLITLQDIVNSARSQESILTSQDGIFNLQSDIPCFGFSFSYIEYKIAMYIAIKYMRKGKLPHAKPTLILEYHTTKSPKRRSTIHIEKMQGFDHHPLHAIQKSKSCIQFSNDGISPKVETTDQKVDSVSANRNLEKSSIQEKLNTSAIQIVKTISGIENYVVHLPIFSSMSTSDRKIIPYLAQTVHNFVEYVHHLLYNISGFEPPITWVIHDSGQHLLWNLQELREEYKKMPLSSFWDTLKASLLSPSELHKYDTKTNAILLKRICCTAKNQPLQELIIHQLIPLLLSVLRHGFQPNFLEEDASRVSIFSSKNKFQDRQLCTLWANVGDTCKWVKTMLLSMKYYSLLKRFDLSNISLHDDNQISSEVIKNALNDHGLANLFVEYARNSANMNQYSEGATLRNREKLQILVDLLSILDEYPWRCTYTFLYHE